MKYLYLFNEKFYDNTSIILIKKRFDFHNLTQIKII
jgi:hypothetical protein